MKAVKLSRVLSALLLVFIILLSLVVLFLLLRGDISHQSPVYYDESGEILHFFGAKLGLPRGTAEKLLSFPEKSLAITGKLLPAGVKNTAIRLWETASHGTAVLIDEIYSYATRGY